MSKNHRSIIVLFNLKPNIDKNQYEEWAKTTDLPVVRNLDSVEKFEILKAQSMLMSGDIPPFEYIEIISVSNMESFSAHTNTPIMDEVKEQFLQFCDQPKFIICEGIEENHYGSLSGKVAVVTGSGRIGGLGAAIARHLAKEGAVVVVSDLDMSDKVVKQCETLASTIELVKLVEEIENAGGTASAYAADVSIWQEVESLANYAIKTYGRLDIWINNAGIGYMMKPIMELQVDEWQSVIDVNLTGCFYGIKAAAKHMIAQGEGGRIINIASQAAKSGFPYAQAYCASKHGLVGLVRSAAIELGEHQITVNNVCPNHVTTDLGAWQNEYFSNIQGKTLEQYLADMEQRIPLGRTGKPEDTANAVAFLCSGAAAYITAESMNVSGGEEPH